MRRERYDSSWLPVRMQHVDPPLRRFSIRGNRALLDDCQRVAIVGSRHPRSDCSAIARTIAQQVAAGGACVVSGLAMGVDAAAHEGALDAAGATIAVLGSGVDRPYPRRNVDLCARIVERGGLVVSEYEDDAVARPHQFAERNRIIAALAEVVVIIQARDRSGSMITARRALDLGCEVAVVPGWVGDPEFAGSLGLIRDGATVVTCANDVLRIIGLVPCTTAHAHQFGSLLDVPRTVGEIAAFHELGVAQVCSQLFELEATGVVSRTPDGMWMNIGAGMQPGIPSGSGR